MGGSAELPVKLELRYAIEAKRAEKGLEMPIIQDIHRRLPRELTMEEEERRQLRRERNKVAASRCRVKRKCHVKKLLKESDELTRANNSLQNEIEQLEYERNKLEGVIRNHVCEMNQSSSTTSPTNQSESSNDHGIEMAGNLIPRDTTRRCYGN